MLRIVLFLATNLAVMVLLTIVVKVTGLDVYAYRPRRPQSAGAAGDGGGARHGRLVHLARDVEVDREDVGPRAGHRPSRATRPRRWLVDTVRSHAEKAGIGMPEVAIYDAPEMNAFATGMSKNNALVAVSTGLLQSMDREQVDAVLGHEITHVANGDMVTMALIQGVLNTFVIFLARVIGTLVDRAISGNRDRRRRLRVFRHRDRAADRARLSRLADRHGVLALARVPRRRRRRASGRTRSMISALQRLGGDDGQSTLPKAIQAFGITGESGIARLLRSHPPIAGAHCGAAGGAGR